MTAGRCLGFLALAAAVAVSAGCGRKGPLETPYSAALEARKEAKEAGQPLPPEPEKPVEDRPFILDPLL